MIIQKVEAEEIKKISSQNTTVRMDEYLMSLPKEVIGKIMMDRGAVIELMGRLQTTLESEYLCVYGGFLDDELVGYVTLTRCTDMPEIQIEVLPEYHGQGFGHEMLCQVIRLAYDELGVEMFKYVVNPANRASIALVERLGGILQAPKSYAEEMLLKTYILSAEVLGACDA